MNIQEMRASWLAAVEAGAESGFSRMFVPEILDELEKAMSERDNAIAALIWAHDQSCEPFMRGGVCVFSTGTAGKPMRRPNAKV